MSKWHETAPADINVSTDNLQLSSSATQLLQTTSDIMYNITAKNISYQHE
jgi:hypothetical protein